MTQFTQGLGFDLADAFACDGKRLSDFFECVFAAIFKSKPHPDDYIAVPRFFQ
jgi:hypothetical protein